MQTPVGGGGSTSRGPADSSRSLTLRAATPVAGLEHPDPVRAAGRGRVGLEIFDASGRRVRSLVRGMLAAGQHRMSWDGKDAAGRSVPSGRYLLRLQACGQQETVFLLRLK